MIGLARHLVDPVHVDRAQRVAFVDREIFGPAVNLPRPGMHDRDPGIDRPACFQELQLRCAVDREVVLGRRHRIEMAGLRRQVEQKILAGKQMRQRKSATDIGNVDRHPIAHVGDVGEIAAIIRDHAVDEEHLGPKRDETPSDRGADQAQSAGNHRPGASIGIQARVSARSHSSSLGIRHPLPTAFARYGRQRDRPDSYSSRRQSTRPPVSVGDLQVRPFPPVT